MRIGSTFCPCCWLTVLGVTAWASVASAPQAGETGANTKSRIDFNRQIRPILSENCFACHGPDEKQRKAKLRLDIKEGAFAKLRGGGFAIVPGKANESELVARTSSHEPSEMMPPPKSGKKLKPEEIALLKQWVDQGAPWSSPLGLRAANRFGSI